MLVWGNIILFITSYKNLTTINKIISFYLLLGFFVMQSIFLFRYEQDTYFLNSELLLILGFSILLRNFLSKKLLYIFLLTLISLISVPTYNNFSSLRAYNNTSYCSDFDNFTSANEYYEFWTNKIPTNVRKNFCKNF